MSAVMPTLFPETCRQGYWATCATDSARGQPSENAWLCLEQLTVEPAIEVPDSTSAIDQCDLEAPGKDSWTLVGIICGWTKVAV